MFRNVLYRTAVAPVDALARFGYWTMVDGAPDILPERSERTELIAAMGAPARVIVNTVHWRFDTVYRPTDERRSKT